MVSIIREGIEDFRRYRSDRKTNMMGFKKLLSKGQFCDIQSKDIKVGDILLVEENSTFPADMILLKSSGELNCYIQTSSLDGEKNLKKRTIPLNFEEYVKPFDEKDFQCVGRVVTEHPTIDLYSFKGKMIVGNEQYRLDVKQLLIKGSDLKNTEWIIGIVIYTGKDTKIMMNSQRSRTKRSHVEKILNMIIFFVFIFQIILCGVVIILSALNDNLNYTNKDAYLGAGNSKEILYLTYFTYFLLFNTMIPISLIITLEIVKVFQCVYMMWDTVMFSLEDNAGCNVTTTTINEELGQIKYIFSDKTGTFTQNMMEFKALCIEEEIYGTIENDKVKRRASRVESISEVEYTFKSHKMEKLLADKDYEFGVPLIINSKNGKTNLILNNDREKLVEVLKLLALCHECVPEIVTVDGEKKLFFQGPSPDETTLVDFAQKNGFEFYETTEMYAKVKFFPKSGFCDQGCMVKTFDIHRRIEFNSDRKRMSVLLTDPFDGKVKLYIKGADSIIKERINKQTMDQKVLDSFDSFLAQASIRGLRTLLLAVRVFDMQEFREMMSDIADAEDDIENRDMLLDHIYDKYEQDLTIIGATAVEDLLQEDLSSTLEDFRKAGIKVWMLTGDKLETAKNIGYSCSLLTQDMVIFEAKGSVAAEKLFNDELVKSNQSLLSELRKRAIVIDADALSFLVLNPDSLK